MIVRADVKCYFCGHIAGEVEGEYATLARRHEFRPLTPRDERTVGANGNLRCPRCGGPVFLEGVEHVRARRPHVELTAADFAEPMYGDKKAS